MVSPRAKTLANDRREGSTRSFKAGVVMQISMVSKIPYLEERHCHFRKIVIHLIEELLALGSSN